MVHLGLFLSLLSAVAFARPAVNVEVRLSGSQSRCEKYFTPDPTTPGTYTLQRRSLTINAQLAAVQVRKAPLFMGSVIEMAIKGAMATFFPGGRLASELTALPGVDGPGHDRLTVATEADGSRTITAEGSESFTHLAQNTVAGKGPVLRFPTDQCTVRRHSIRCSTDGAIEPGPDADAFWDAMNRSLSEAILRRILTTAMAQHAQGANVGLSFQWRQRTGPRLEEDANGALILHGPLYDVTIVATVEK